MDLSDRRVIFGCCGGLVLFLAVILVGGWIFYKHAIEPNLPQMSPPESLEAEGPSVGAELMERSVFFEDGRLGPVTCVEVGDFNAHPGSEIVCAGIHGAAVLDDGGTVLSTVRYQIEPDPYSARRVDVIDVESDGVCEYLAHYLEAAGGPVVLLDHQGSGIWESDEVPKTLIAGDVDGDGEVEFCGRTHRGIALVETDGDIEWERDLPHPSGESIGMIDLAGDSAVEIVHALVQYSQRRVEIVGRDSDGEVVYSADHPGVQQTLLNTFAVCPWPSTADDPHLLALGHKSLLMIKTSGETVFDGRAPSVTATDQIWAGPARLISGERSFVASITFSPMHRRTILFVHSAGGDLLFEHPTNVDRDGTLWPGLAAWQPPGEDHEVLLVGGMGKVWKYEMTNSGLN